MTAPAYIQRKQLIALCLSLIMIGFKEISQYFLIFSLVIASSFIFPLLKQKIQYNLIVQRFLLISSLFYSLLFIDDTFIFGNFKNPEFFLGGLFAVLVMLLSKRHSIKGTLKTEVFASIDRKTFFLELIVFLVSIVGEELFFRVYTISFFKTQIGWFSIIISSGFFVLSHYLNRWSSNIFTLKSYIYQFILAMVLGTVYYYSTNFLYVISLHILYNFSFLVVIIKKLKYKNSEMITFDDYD